MNKGLRYREQVLDEAFFRAVVPWAGVSSAFEVSLHAAAPQDDRGRLVNEIAYPGYQRIRLARDHAAWRRNGNQVENRIEARFALCQTGPRQVATHWAITPTGRDAPAWQGKFEQALVIEPGIRPVIDPGAILVREE